MKPGEKWHYLVEHAVEQRDRNGKYHAYPQQQIQINQLGNLWKHPAYGPYQKAQGDCYNPQPPKQQGDIGNLTSALLLQPKGNQGKGDVANQHDYQPDEGPEQR